MKLLPAKSSYDNTLSPTWGTPVPYGDIFCVFIKLKKKGNLKEENNLESQINVLERPHFYTDSKKQMLFEMEENVLRVNIFSFIFCIKIIWHLE